MFATVAKVWIPQGVSRALSASTNVALSLLLYERTGSALALATALAISMLASIYASPLVGGVVDHVPLRLALAVGNVLLALAALALGIAAMTEQWWVLYALLALSGAVDAVITVGQQAAVRDVVSEQHLVRANAFIALLQSAPMVVGPALGAALYAALPFTVIVGLDAASFALAGFGALALPHMPARKPDSWLRLPFSGAWEGLRDLWQSPAMRAAQLWYSLANVGNGLGAGILSAYILAHAHSPRATLGWFGTFGSVGVVATTLLLTIVGLPGRRSHWVIAGLLAACLGGRLPLVVTASAVAICGVGLVRSVALEVSQAPLLAIWQAAAPKERQGRIFGARRMLAQAPYPIAVWCGGGLAEVMPQISLPDAAAWLGLPAHLDAMGGVMVLGAAVELLAALGLWTSGSLRRLEGAA